MQPSVTIGSRSYSTWTRQSSSMKLTISTATSPSRRQRLIVALPGLVGHVSEAQWDNVEGAQREGKASGGD
jgi:hypothetical protein